MRNKSIRQFVGIFALLLLVIPLQAQAVESATSSRILDWLFDNIIFIMGAITALAASISVLYLNNKLLEIQKIRLLKEHGLEVMEEVKLLDKEPWWNRFNRKAWDLVPMEKERDILLDHNYDGIKELDNVLPPWWVAMFYITIAFAVVYLGYYHVWDKGSGSAEEYAIEMEQAQKAVDQYLAAKGNLVNESNVVMVEDEMALSLGETLFRTNCTPCHGQLGEGNSIGPNLTDKYWVHGGGIKDIFKVIKNGIPEKGMIAWKSQLAPADIQKVASFILSLQGTNPPNAKDPQGELYEAAEEG